MLRNPYIEKVHSKVHNAGELDNWMIYDHVPKIRKHIPNNPNSKFGLQYDSGLAEKYTDPKGVKGNKSFRWRYELIKLWKQGNIEKDKRRLLYVYCLILLQ